MADGAVHFVGELPLVGRLSFLAVNQQLRKCFAARKTSDVGNKDSVSTEDHVSVLIMPFLNKTAPAY